MKKTTTDYKGLELFLPLKLKAVVDIGLCYQQNQCLPSNAIFVPHGLAGRCAPCRTLFPLPFPQCPLMSAYLKIDASGKTAATQAHPRNQTKHIYTVFNAVTAAFSCETSQNIPQFAGRGGPAVRKRTAMFRKPLKHDPYRFISDTHAQGSSVRSPAAAEQGETPYATTRTTTSRQTRSHTHKSGAENFMPPRRPIRRTDQKPSLSLPLPTTVSLLPRLFCTRPLPVERRRQGTTSTSTSRPEMEDGLYGHQMERELHTSVRTGTGAVLGTRKKKKGE